MKVGDVVELELDAMSFGPAAVGRLKLEGEPRPMVIFVEGGAPGEKARVELTRNNKSYWEAKLLKVLNPSTDRIKPPCEVFERCGGCQWQHLSYPAQLKAKEAVLLHQIGRTTHQSETKLRSLLTTHGAASPLGYRARLQAHGDPKGIGFFAKGSHSIVHTPRCIVAHPDIQGAWSEFLVKRPLASLSRTTGSFKIEWTRTGPGQVIEALNRKHGAFGFSQVNPEQNEILKGVVSELAGTGAVLLDLYGGDGNLSDALMSRFERIISVDAFGNGEDPAAIKPTETGRIFVKEHVEDFLVEQRWRDWKIERPDCVIADPPRAGLEGAAAGVAGLKAPRIVLVSCDPSTLARDLSHFKTSGYEVKRIHLVDMFPQTYHIEAAVLLALGGES